MPALQRREEPREEIVLAAERELHDFTYLVAHDLASEFRHVAAFSRLLVEEVSEGAARTHAEMIWESSSRCQKMLSALMVYSVVQTQKLARRTWHARSVVERAIAELGEQQTGRAARIEVDVTGDVFGDARLLVMAVRLALMNALEAAREGVDLAITVRGATDMDGVWTLDIADNGEGLAREYREKAFTMFWRLNPDTAGIGAGLPTIRRIARRHGGEAMFVDSVEGARLQIAIPATEAEQ